jgi:hypothetical protein
MGSLIDPTMVPTLNGALVESRFLKNQGHSPRSQLTPRSEAACHVYRERGRSSDTHRANPPTDSTRIVVAHNDRGMSLRSRTPSANTNPRAAASRSWRASLIPSRVQVLGDVQAATRQAGELTAIRQFELDATAQAACGAEISRPSPPSSGSPSSGCAQRRRSVFVSFGSTGSHHPARETVALGAPCGEVYDCVVLQPSFSQTGAWRTHSTKSGRPADTRSRAGPAVCAT